jgi:excisionase family DNA binding protein
MHLFALVRRLYTSKISGKMQERPYMPSLLLSVSEAAKFLGVSTRTIRRALSTQAVTSIVVKDRHKITLDSLLAWARATPTVEKKLQTMGFGAFVEVWKPVPTKHEPLAHNKTQETA